ncbi:fructose-6-phosphate aldolase [bacterium 3DAC]|nr:fructose-6-phosphate aldolase [bacterium 3DAC]
MKIYLDTANLQEIEAALKWGVLDGVTTNPTLIAREGRDPDIHFKDILKLVYPRPVSLEVVSEDAEGMIKEARELSNLSDNVVVKIPMTPDGIKAVTILSNEGIKTNVTLIFTPMQALLAAKAGATYVSPFMGRLDDRGWDGVKLVEEIVDIFWNYDFDTEIIAASTRSVRHVKEVALLGVDIVTMPFKVLKQMFNHPLTDEGIERFKSDWQALQQKLGK